MAKLDPFSAQLVSWVRQMPDEALLDLIHTKLGGLAGAARSESVWNNSSSVLAHERAGRKTRSTVKSVAKRGRRPSAAKQKLLTAIETTIKKSKGVSASEIAKVVKVAQPRVQLAVRELKAAKRIYQGGDRRFARYAADAKTAEQASVRARKTASGPQHKSKTLRRKKR